MKLIFFVGLCTIALASSKLSLPKLQTCTQDSECGANECCGIQTGPLIVSKRQSLYTGTCKPYLQLDEYCYGQWKQNGACGCAPTMTCKYFPPPTTSVLHPVGKRRPMAGQYLCKPT